MPNNAAERLKARKAGKSAAPAYNPLDAITPFTSPEAKNDVILVKDELLDDFTGHTFKHGENSLTRVGQELSDYEQAMLDSIKENGILQPLFIRPSKAAQGRYEIIAGHTRRRLGRMAGLAEFPCIVRDVDDDVATIFMIETNLQRPDWLPSEKATSYKAHLEATARILDKKAGRPATDWSERDIEQVPGRVRDIAAQRFGITGKTLEAYIKLNDIHPYLLDMVDEKRISVKAGYNLAFLSPVQQASVLSLLNQYPHIKVDEKKAADLRLCDQSRWPEILGIRKAKKNAEPQVRLSLPFKRLRVPKDEFNKPEFIDWLVETINKNYGKE